MRIVTFNLGLLSLMLAGRWRIDLSPHVPGRLAAAPAALKATGADVLLLQEVFVPADRAALIEALHGAYPYHATATLPAPWLGNGLMVLSRHPLSDARFVPYRDRDLLHRFWLQGFLVATVHDPVLGAVRLMNVHLSITASFRHPEAPQSIACRGRETAALLALAEEAAVDIIAGDFNCGPDSDAGNYRHMLEAGNVDSFVACNGPDAETRGCSWSRSNPIAAKGRYRFLPDHRVDHVFIRDRALSRFRPGTASLALDSHVVETVTGCLPLSDHYAMLVDLVSGIRS